MLLTLLYGDVNVLMICDEYRRFGHAVTSACVMTASHNTKDHSVESKKDTLKVLSLVHGSVAGLMAHDVYKEEIKKPIGIAQICLHAGLATACLVRGFGKEKEEKDDVADKKK